MKRCPQREVSLYCQGRFSIWRLLWRQCGTARNSGDFPCSAAPSRGFASTARADSWIEQCCILPRRAEKPPSLRMRTVCLMMWETRKSAKMPHFYNSFVSAPRTSIFFALVLSMPQQLRAQATSDKTHTLWKANNLAVPCQAGAENDRIALPPEQASYCETAFTLQVAHLVRELDWVIQVTQFIHFPHVCDNMPLNRQRYATQFCDLDVQIEGFWMSTVEPSFADTSSLRTVASIPNTGQVWVTTSVIRTPL